MPIIRNPADLFAGARDATLQTTVCVIGSGFSGAIVAVDLAMAGIEVLLLESGSSEPDHRIDSMLDRVDVSGRTQLNFGFSRQLGGASNLWAGRVAPLDPVDFECREWIPHSGWPISRSDLEPYYVRAGDILGIPGYSTFHEPGHARPGFVATDNIELKSFQWANRPFNAGEYIKETVERTDRLRVLMNAPVVELLERENARSVEAAVIALPDGQTARIQARHFVIAGGGIQTPRLLLNSTRVRSAGIGGDHGVVGRYLSTHPKANMATMVLRAPVSTHHPLFSDQPVTGGVLRYGVGFSAASQKTFRLLNHYVQVLPFLEHRANKLFEMIRGSDRFNSPLIDRAALISGFVPGMGKIAFEMMGRLGGLQRRARKFILRAYLDQYPNPENRVTLSEKKDGHGMPRVNVTWAFSENDRSSVIAFFERLEREMESRGIARLDYSRLRTTDDWPLIGLHSHFMGTTRMGNDPRTSVTTKDGRVHGSDNVFVAGPSLFPNCGYANPVFTIAALSLRLADHVKSRPGV